MKWVERSLNELGSVSRGRSRHRPRDAEHLYDGPYPFVQTGDVKHAGLYLTNYEQTYSEAGLAQSKLWGVGTLCITIAANIADTSILGIEACFPDSVIGFIADKTKADTRFVKYLFDAHLKKRYRTFSQGVAQDNLSQDKLLSIKFRMPPDVGEQTQIADVLSAYDEKIGNNMRRIELLEQSAQNLFKEWFVHLRYPGHEHDKIVDGVPRKWRRARLAELVNTQYGYTDTATDEPIGPRFLRGTDINKTSYISWSEVPYCSERNLDFEKYALQRNDIVVIRMADPGKVAIVEKEIAAIFASYLVRLSLNDRSTILPYYLFYSLSDESYQGFITGASTGSTRKTASAPLLTSFDVLLPPMELQASFSEQIISVRSYLNNLVDQNAALGRARDLLLPRLMDGRLTV